MWVAIVDDLVIAEANSCLELCHMIGIAKSTGYLAADRQMPVKYGDRQLYISRIFPKKACVICGAEFEDRTRNRMKLTCSNECAKQLAKDNQSEWHKGRSEGRKYKSIYVRSLQKREKTVEGRMKELADFNTDAIRSGMSYGEYEAYLHREEMKIDIEALKAKVHGIGGSGNGRRI